MKEKIYIRKLKDGTIKRHVGEPVGEGTFILLEPECFSNNAKEPIKEKNKYNIWMIAFGVGVIASIFYIIRIVL